MSNFVEKFSISMTETIPIWFLLELNIFKKANFYTNQPMQRPNH